MIIKDPNQLGNCDTPMRKRNILNSLETSETKINYSRQSNQYFLEKNSVSSKHPVLFFHGILLMPDKWAKVIASYEACYKNKSLFHFVCKRLLVKS